MKGSKWKRAELYLPDELASPVGAAARVEAEGEGAADELASTAEEEASIVGVTTGAAVVASGLSDGAGSIVTEPKGGEIEKAMTESVE